MTIRQAADAMTPRYKMARERSGLSLAQATKMAGIDVHSIEAGEPGPSDEEIKVLAEVYQVTECWLRGHTTSPDLTDLARQAEDKGVSLADWREIAMFAQAMTTCDACKAGSAQD